MKLYFLSTIPIVMSLALAYMFPLNELIPIVTFWIFLTYLLFNTVFRAELQVMGSYKRKGTKWGIFFSYLITHYLVYSVAIVELLTYIYKPTISNPQTAFVSLFNTPFGISPSITNLGLSLIFNPTITAFIPPNIVIDLSLYSISMGLYIAILVTSSLITIISLNKKLKYLVFIPLIGIIAGASCCVSIPVLLAESVEVSNLIFLTTVGWQAVFIAYVSLPILTVIFLKHLSSSLHRLHSGLVEFNTLRKVTK
ncbi:hypothetical protein HFC64_10095 [Saccharolobus solfataricus]|uniref:Uncharacterized protein n=2 Tax=Saccharolobus solfataricus TaxID=2287 RepID=Q97UN7_SACS2|nr:hypothetical protein [Saccharolobus solfataricus]AAK43071.1 Hypothetical protein SSO2966 [Saccharolobus solfataricus P2]QPG50116.1 hypothetical protein HFC64_10095 [Saccharolobus solfataricus]SAI86620.1 uncharacterised protein [Saccharolobus solfataricus]